MDRRSVRPVVQGAHPGDGRRPSLTELGAQNPKRRFTIGITDDVGQALSLTYDDTLDIEEPDTPCEPVFYGLGSDGTVGANKNTIKILGADPDVYAQAYFV